MKTWQEKQRDAARLAEAERIAEEKEQEELESAIEAEQCAFVEAGDAIASYLLGYLEIGAAVKDFVENFDKIQDPVFFSKSFIEGLRFVFETRPTLRGAATNPALLIILEAMAAHDPTRDAGPGSGQIERQAKECREALSKSDS